MKISFQGQYVQPSDSPTFTFHLDLADIRIVREWTPDFPACITVIDGPALYIRDEAEARTFIDAYKKEHT